MKKKKVKPKKKSIQDPLKYSAKKAKEVTLKIYASADEIVNVLFKK